MIDYIVSGVIIIFIITVLVWLRRRENREKLAAANQAAAQVTPDSQTPPASQPAAASQPASDGQRLDDQRG